MLAAKRLVVFTDLDGTLLDHDTYSYEAARPALDRLRGAKVPVVLTTSKTHAETAELRRELGLDAPFVTENGGAASWGTGYFLASAAVGLETADGGVTKVFGTPRDVILGVLAGLTERFRFRGFSAMDAEEVAERTGLSVERARLALMRASSEPLVWQGSDGELLAFGRELAERGLRLVRGGRFQHVIGHEGKANAVRWLMERFRERDEAEFVTIALGDSPNDERMLSTVDYAVVIRSALSDKLEPRPSVRTIRTLSAGPVGWQEAMDGLLPELFGEEVADG